MCFRMGWDGRPGGVWLPVARGMAQQCGEPAIALLLQPCQPLAWHRSLSWPPWIDVLLPGVSGGACRVHLRQAKRWSTDCKQTPCRAAVGFLCAVKGVSAFAWNAAVWDEHLGTLGCSSGLVPGTHAWLLWPQTLVVQPHAVRYAAAGSGQRLRTGWDKVVVPAGRSNCGEEDLPVG